MEIYERVVEKEDKFVPKAFISQKDMPQVINFYGRNFFEMFDECDEKNTLVEIEDISEKRYIVEENIFEEAKKTVQDIVSTVAVLEEDILDPVLSTQDILETVTVIQDDILKIVSAVAETILPLVDIDQVSYDFIVDDK